MSGPWLDYQPTQGAAPPPAGAGPWNDYAPPSSPAGDSGIPADFHGLVVPVQPRGTPLPPAKPQADFAGVQPGTLAPGVQTPDNSKPQPPSPSPPQGLLGTTDNPSQLQSGLRGAAQGATLGWGDELHGLVMAGGDGSGLPGSPLKGALRLAGEKLLPSVFGSPTTISDLVAPDSGSSASDAYARGVQDERNRNRIAQETNPGSYLTGELAGGIGGAVAAPPLTPFKAAADAGLVARTATGAGNLATTGGAYGAIAGAGSADGDISDRLSGAAQGALTGAVLTPAFGGALTGAKNIVAPIVGHMRATFSPQSLADQIVAQSAGRDSADLPAIADQMRSAQAQGQPLTMADVAGPNTQALTGTVTRLPGPARTQAQEFLHTRQLGSETTPSQGDRITGALTDLVGSDQGSLATAKTIMQRRAAQVKPLYDSGDTQPIDYGSQAGQRLEATLDRIPNAAKAKANEILQISDEGGSQPIWRQAASGPNKGSYELGTAPNVRQWRYIRQGLDAAIEGDRDQFGRVGTIGHALQGLRSEISSALHDVSPMTAKADQIFSGESQMLDALREGKKAFAPSITPEAIRAQVAKLSPGEAEMFRLGAINALKEKLANAADGVDKARLAVGNKAIREKIAAIVPDTTARTAFMTALRNESAMFATRAKATGNSATAERLSEDSETVRKMADNMHVVSSLLSGQFKDAFIAAARHMAKLDPSKRGAVLSAIRDIALNPSPEAVEAFADRITKTQMKDGTRQRVIASVMKALPRSAATTTVIESNEKQPAEAAP